MTWYLQQSPDVAHLPMDDVLKASKEGFTSDESIIDSKMPGLSSLMMQLPNSREKWFSERLGIEAMSRDFGDPNLFLTINTTFLRRTGRLIHGICHRLKTFGALWQQPFMPTPSLSHCNIEAPSPKSMEINFSVNTSKSYRFDA